MPARLADLTRALRSMGVNVEKPRSGSHYRAVRGGTVYPIPAHNGPKTEITDTYIHGVCRALELDEDALRKLL